MLALAGCARDAASDLISEHGASLPIDGAAPRVVSFDLAPGAHLVEAREQGIDFRMVLDAGTMHRELVDAVPRHGLLASVIVLGAPTTVRVSLLSTDHRSRQGLAQLRIARWKRAADGTPGERELGFLAFALAGEQTSIGTQDSWSRAAAALNEAAAHFAEANDEPSRAQALYTLGHLQYLERDDRAAAIRAAETAGEIYRSLDDDTGMHNAATLRAASELEIAAGMTASTQGAEQRALYAAADRRLADAAQYFSAHALPINAAYAVNMRGVRALYAGDIEQAATHFAKAVDMAVANHDDGERLKSLANLAWVHNRLGFVAEAAHEYAQLLPLIERERQPALYGAILNNYGFCLVALGEFDRALALHTEALQVFEAAGQELEQARQLQALGGLYFRTGDLERSLEASRAAIEVQERIKDGIGEAGSLRLAGNAAAALDQHAVALEYLRKSAQIDSSPATVARARVLIAGELRALGDLRGAESELESALQSSNALARAEALDERGRLRLAQRKNGAAVADLRAADQQFTELGLDFNRIDTNTTMSQALLAAGDVQGAIAAADQAVEIVTRIRVNSANPEWRARFLSARYLPYEARITAELAAGTEPLASAWRTFAIAEQVRARSLADTLAGAEHRGARAPDPEGDALRAQLTSLQLRLESRASRQETSEPELQELRRAIIETRARIDARNLQDGVSTESSRLPPGLQELQARLPADIAVLAYFVGDAATHGWLLTRQELRHATFGGRHAMSQLTSAFVASQRENAGGSRARETSASVLGNLLDGIAARRVLVIPDGPLNGLPFAALPLPAQSPGTLLVDRFVLGYAPSLALALRQSGPHVASSKRFAVVSDPVYAPDDRRLVASIAAGGNLRGKPQLSPNRLTRLPYSALEARAVARALGDDTIQLAGFEATPARVLALKSGELAVLHFATHAVARTDSPEQSALYLSEYSPDGALLDDSTLSVGEITRAGLRADLVVLSGCETGNGSRLRGEGVLGLTYGFLSNGSQAVVAALWPIEDAATAKFMNEFYRAYHQSGKTAEALRQAQLSTRGSVKAAVWSSFVVRANEFP